MGVRAVTSLVEPHGLVIVPRPDSDHENYDRARDDLAVDDPYEPDWEPAYTHGPVKALDVAGSFPATPASAALIAGPVPADARATPSPPGCAGSRATTKS